MLISACYATKNGAEFLEESLLSIKDYVDEIIIADDNSTDATQEISMKYKTKLIIDDYSKLDDNSKLKNMGHFKPIIKQKNDCLKKAKGKWILFLDDDEVYHPEDIKWLREYSVNDDPRELRWNFIHFWKQPNKQIVGHTWNISPQRFYYKGDLKLKYKNREDLVCFEPQGGGYVSDKGKVYIKHINCYHYSYLKSEKFIEAKIRRYLLRENPNVNKKNIDKWIKKHPYFSNEFNQPRYGKNGLYCAGNESRVIETVINYPIDRHPKHMYKKFNEMGFDEKGNKKNNNN